MNAKIYNGNVQPNHKEYKIWVNDEGIIKTWNGTEWIEQSGASSDGSEESGGSGSGSGEASSIEYLDVSGSDEANMARFLAHGYIVKFVANGQAVFLPTAHPYVGGLMKVVSPSAISIDFTAVITFEETNQNMTIKEALLQTGSTPITEEQLDAIPRITKEQFYSLE